MSEQTLPALHLAGYRVVDTYNTISEIPCVQLSFELEDLNGVVRQSGPFVSLPDKPENYPERERQRLLAEAMCRYLNTHTDAEPATECLHVDVQNMAYVVAKDLPRFTIDPDWKLFYTSENEHIFRNEKTAQYYRIVDGMFTEELTQEEIIDLAIVDEDMMTVLNE